MYSIDNLSNLDLGDLHYNEPLSDHSTWKIGGPADFFIEPSSIEQILQVVQIANSNKIPLVVIGNGSNVLFSDKGIRGIVLKLGNKFSRFEINGTRITSESGIYVPTLAEAAGKAGLSGLEHTIGIPGSLGGLVCMNGGSQRKSIGEIVKNILVIDRQGTLNVLSWEQCNFSYRSSAIQKSGYIICQVTLECKKDGPLIIRKEMESILEVRRKKFPMNYPSCGSVFTSNIPVQGKTETPGKLIEEIGLKGFRIGGAEVSTHHANFIINKKDATASDVIAVVQYIREKIYQIHYIWLESEVKYIDENGIIRPLHELNPNDPGKVNSS